MMDALIASALLSSAWQVQAAAPPPIIRQVVRARSDLPIIAKSPDQTALAAGVRLAEVLNPADLVVAVEMRSFDEQLIPGLRKQPEFLALEAEYPGLIDFLARDMRPLIEHYSKMNAPKAQKRMGLFFAQRLTIPELTNLLSFYTSPTGQKLVRAVMTNISMETIVEEVIADPDAPTSLDAINNAYEPALKALPSAMDASDKAALVAFMQRPVFAKLRTLGPAMRRLQQAMINEPDPDFERLVQERVDTGIAQFIADADAARAED